MVVVTDSDGAGAGDGARHRPPPLVEAVNTAALPPWFVDGLVEYSARRIVTPMFQGDNLQPGYAMFEQRYFGGFVPRFIRLRLLPRPTAIRCPRIARIPVQMCRRPVHQKRCSASPGRRS